MAAALLVALLSSSVPGVGELTLGKHGLGGLRGGYSSTNPNPKWLLDDDGKPWTPVEQLVKEQILEEIARLEGRRPGYGGPATLFVLGLLVALTGVGFVIGGGIDTAISGVISWALYVGAGGVVVGLVLMIWGLVRLGTVLNERQRYDWRLDRLKERLEALDKLTRVPGAAPAELFTVARF